MQQVTNEVYILMGIAGLFGAFVGYVIGDILGYIRASKAALKKFDAMMTEWKKG